MKGKKLFQEIGNIEDLIERSESGKKKIHWVKWGSIAACIVLITCSIIIAVIVNKDHSDTESGVPDILINSIIYYKSGWDTAVMECPDGFQYSGTVETTNDDGKYLLGCKYYINNDIPEWIYVYCKVWDEYNHVSMAFVRFVTADIRWNIFINYNGNIYVNLMSYTASTESSESFYNYKLDLENRYGLEIEAAVPEGCSLAGNAHLETLDRIPQTELGINSTSYDNATVYINPEDNQAIYVGTSWYTATGEETGETLHTGYDVFVLYDSAGIY